MKLIVNPDFIRDGSGLVHTSTAGTIDGERALRAGNPPRRAAFLRLRARRQSIHSMFSARVHDSADKSLYLSYAHRVT